METILPRLFFLHPLEIVRTIAVIMEATSYEQEHDITPGTESRDDVARETDQEKVERINRDIRAGLRAPKPETVDNTKSTVTGEQVAAVEKAAYKPHRGSGEVTEEEMGVKRAGDRQGGHDESDNVATDDLENHTVDELKTIAHREDADINSSMTKADIIKAIKKNRKK